MRGQRCRQSSIMRNLNKTIGTFWKKGYGDATVLHVSLRIST